MVCERVVDGGFGLWVTGGEGENVEDEEEKRRKGVERMRMSSADIVFRRFRADACFIE